MQNPTNTNFDMSLAEDMTCGECKNVYFKSLIRVKKISALVSPNGQETYVPVQVLACAKCGNMVQDVENKENQ